MASINPLQNHGNVPLKKGNDGVSQVSIPDKSIYKSKNSGKVRLNVEKFNVDDHIFYMDEKTNLMLLCPWQSGYLVNSEGLRDDIQRDSQNRITGSLSGRGGYPSVRVERDDRIGKDYLVFETTSQNRSLILVKHKLLGWQKVYFEKKLALGDVDEFILAVGDAKTNHLEKNLYTMSNKLKSGEQLVRDLQVQQQNNGSHQPYVLLGGLAFLTDSESEVGVFPLPPRSPELNQVESQVEHFAEEELSELPPPLPPKPVRKYGGETEGANQNLKDEAVANVPSTENTPVSKPMKKKSRISPWLIESLDYPNLHVPKFILDSIDPPLDPRVAEQLAKNLSRFFVNNLRDIKIHFGTHETIGNLIAQCNIAASEVGVTERYAWIRGHDDSLGVMGPKKPDLSAISEKRSEKIKNQEASQGASDVSVWDTPSENFPDLQIPGFALDGVVPMITRNVAEKLAETLNILNFSTFALFKDAFSGNDGTFKSNKFIIQCSLAATEIGLEDPGYFWDESKVKNSPNTESESAQRLMFHRNDTRSVMAVDEVNLDSYGEFISDEMWDTQAEGYTYPIPQFVVDCFVPSISNRVLEYLIKSFQRIEEVDELKSFFVKSRGERSTIHTLGDFKKVFGKNGKLNVQGLIMGMKFASRECIVDTHRKAMEALLKKVPVSESEVAKYRKKMLDASKMDLSIFQFEFKRDNLKKD